MQPNTELQYVKSDMLLLVFGRTKIRSLKISSISYWRNINIYSIFCIYIAGHPCILLIFRFHNFCSLLIKEQILSDDLFTQGSEIFTVIAKDGDVGNPNPIRYSFDEGKHVTQRKLERFFFSQSQHAQRSVVSPGDDGVFFINKTSGCITLQTLPIYLKREIFNIKVRVSCG